MGDSRFGGFFGVAARSRTWLNLVFQVVSFPLGLCYFVFLITGLSLGLSLLVVWIGIPILLIVVGSWWLLGAFERLQARYLLGAEVGPSLRSWEGVDGVWPKLKAHFGASSTWTELVYLLAKLPLGVVSFALAVTLAAAVFWLFFMPVAAVAHIPIVNDTWIPPLWLGVVAVPAAVLAFFLSLHLLNAWGFVCARWAELLLGRPQRSPVRPTAAAPPAPLVSTGPPLAPPTLPTGPPLAPPTSPTIPSPQDASRTGAPAISPPPGIPAPSPGSAQDGPVLPGGSAGGTN
jgi:hypothetical protein